MKVVIGCDFSAITLKNQVKEYLSGKGYEMIDIGQNEGDDQLIYPYAAKRVAEKIRSGEAEKGIVFCGTGGGVSIVANKFKGVYCVACEGIFTAYKMRQLNNANVIALGKNCIGELLAYDIVDRFLTTPFCYDYDTERTAFVSGLRDRMIEIENENLK